MAPVIIMRRLGMSTMFLAPATLRVGAYTTKPCTSMPRRPARPAICQNSSGRSQRCPLPRSSGFFVYWFDRRSIHEKSEKSERGTR